MKDFELTEENGFIKIHLPKKTNIREFAMKYYGTNNHEILKMLKTSLSDEASNDYYKGDYFIKENNNKHYFILCSDTYIGMCIDSILPDGYEEKSALYCKKDDSLILRWNRNDLDQSTRVSRRFSTKDEIYIKSLSFEKEEIEYFTNRFIEESYECPGVENIQDIDKLRDEILGKSSRIQS